MSCSWLYCRARALGNRRTVVIIAIALLFWGSLLSSQHSAAHSPLLADESHDEKYDNENLCPGASYCLSNSNLIGTASTTSIKLKSNPLRDALFPVPNPDRTDGNVWMDENHRHLKALFTCVELENCGTNQAKGMSRLMLCHLFTLSFNENFIFATC